MIQRIQSIFLAISASAYAGLFGLPFASSDISTSQFLKDKIYNIQDHIVLIILTGLGILLCLVSIFLYKNRALQARLSIFSIVTAILLIIAAVILFYNEANKMLASANVSDQFGLYLPFISILFSALALRYIRKDDNLVKSMDRLR